MAAAGGPESCRGNHRLLGLPASSFRGHRGLNLRTLAFHTHYSATEGLRGDAEIGTFPTVERGRVVPARQGRSPSRALFNDLYRFFQAQYEDLNEMDEVAERARTLGGWALGTLGEFLQNTRLEERPGEYADARTMIALERGPGVTSLKRELPRARLEVLSRLSGRITGSLALPAVLQEIIDNAVRTLLPALHVFIIPVRRRRAGDGEELTGG